MSTVIDLCLNTLERKIDLRLNALERQIDLIVNNLVNVYNFTVKEEILLRSALVEFVILNYINIANDTEFNSNLHKIAIDICSNIKNHLNLNLKCIPTIDMYTSAGKMDFKLDTYLSFEVIVSYFLERNYIDFATSLSYSIVSYNNFIGRTNFTFETSLNDYSIIQSVLLNENKMSISSSFDSIIDLNNTMNSATFLLSSLSCKIVKPRPMSTLTETFGKCGHLTLEQLSYIEV